MKTLFLVTLFFLFSCTSEKRSSNIKMVDLKQTPVKSQEKVGFCWAYRENKACFLKWPSEEFMKITWV